VQLPRPSRPAAAFADLRAFLASRERHHWVFALLSVAVPGYFVAGFIFNTKQAVYKPPEVLFVEKLNENRTDAEIRRDNIAHTAKVRAAEAEQKRLEDERARQFKELGKALDDAGF
jgi:hypothetical protein